MADVEVRRSAQIAPTRSAEPEEPGSSRPWRFRSVSRHQVSGWRFLLHRIEHALVRRDVSMIDDPQRGHSTALTIGIALACVVVAGAAVLAFFKPQGRVGSSQIIADKDSGALFVKMGSRGLYPVLNLISARLITGSATNPVKVPSSEISKYPRGPLLGIPGAPAQMIGSSSRESYWSVCDRVEIGSATPVDPETGLPTSARLPVRTTVIGEKLAVDGDKARQLSGNEARLIRNEKSTWLIYRTNEGKVVRATINLSSSPVVLALGLDASAPVVAASKGLIDAIPEAPALTVPSIPGAGTTVVLNNGVTTKVGSVLTAPTPDRGAGYYLVLRTGVVQVTSVLASMIRNADSQGTVSATTVAPDVIAASLRPGSWPAAAAYPPRPVQLLDPTPNPVTCYSWSRAGAEVSAQTTLIIGNQLPLSPSEQSAAVALVTAQTSNGLTADYALMPRNTGRFVQVTGAEPTSPLRESLWWVSDSGVRYGIDVPSGDSPVSDQSLSALAIGSPVRAPWSIVSLFAPGPTLSQRDARIQHDGIPVDRAAVGFKMDKGG